MESCRCSLVWFGRVSRLGQPLETRLFRSRRRNAAEFAKYYRSVIARGSTQITQSPKSHLCLLHLQHGLRLASAKAVALNISNRYVDKVDCMGFQ